MPDPTRDLLRHLVATLAYRAAKVLRDVPPEFATFTAGPSTRPPVHIVAHMGDLIDWGVWLARGEYRWQPLPSRGWDADVARFFDGLAALDAHLTSDAPLGYTAETIIQGPLADALTHVGQLAMLRGLAEVPVRPESYARAEIVAGRVGREQTKGPGEYDGDASPQGGA